MWLRTTEIQLRLLLLRRWQSLSLDVNFLCAQTFIQMQMILTAENLKPCSHLRLTGAIKNIQSAAGENIEADSTIHKAAGLPAAAGRNALQRPFFHSQLKGFFPFQRNCTRQSRYKMGISPPCTLTPSFV